MKDILADCAHCVPREGSVTNVEADVLQNTVIRIATMLKDV